VVAIRTVIREELPFDLNVGKVLEHWTVAFAIRELIANALDEQTITGTKEPTIVKDDQGRWHIRDFGRGLRYEHLTQDENREKRSHPGVIGQFGMGLKDALAVFDRRRIAVEILSAHGDISTTRRGKEQFSDVVTLHAIVKPASDAAMTGTDVVVTGVSDDDVADAKQFFLRYSADENLESTKFGDVLAPPSGRSRGRIYVKGLLVAEEPNFLFSYNITDLSAQLRRALNRERTNVGRTAYTDRVKSILKNCEGPVVAAALTKDLTEFSTGRQHDELAWRDVARHACRVLATHEKVLFVTPKQLAQRTPQIEYAEQDGYRLVVVPDAIASSLRGLTDLTGAPLIDLGAYRTIWNESFSFRFIPPEELSPTERRWFDSTNAACAHAGIAPERVGVREVLISETMRLGTGDHDVLGVYEPTEKRIIVRRDQLASPAAYFGTLLHELAHAASGATDGTLDFETALTDLVGVLAERLIAPEPNKPTV
jgi:hypothetical protein